MLKIVFKIRYGHYEFLIILFGSTNALVIFINLVNKMFKSYLDQFTVVFIDDVLIYSRIPQVHEKYLRIVL